jgi:transposase InsO family protein
MPWKEHRPVDLKKEFVLAATAPAANVAELCRRYGISRNNGYKWIRRFRREGEAGLEEHSRRPRKITDTDAETVLRLIELRRQYPWGAKKLRQLLCTERGGYVPSAKTVARILDRAGEPRVRTPRRRIRVVTREHESLAATAPHDVWTVDFKGWWRTRDRKRFEPLTVRDAFSRFVLCLEMLGSTRADVVKPAFERLFQSQGLPAVIRVDNGAPFACTSAPAGLSRLSAWWTSLGIRVSFSRPAHPQDNGAHERMHADIASELECDPAATSDVQQRAADRWRHTYNNVRPHEALNMKTPASLYRRSPRRFRGIRPPVYPPTCAVRLVNINGCVHYLNRTVFVSESLIGYEVGLQRTRSGRLAVRFYGLSLGLFEFGSAPLHHRPPLIPRSQLPKHRVAS